MLMGGIWPYIESFKRNQTNIHNLLFPQYGITNLQYLQMMNAIDSMFRNTTPWSDNMIFTSYDMQTTKQNFNVVIHHIGKSA